MKNIKNWMKKTALYKPAHALWIFCNQVPVRIVGAFREKGILLNDNYRELQKYKNIHTGKRCFLIANGPSLNVEDLEILKDEICFGCNKIYYLFEKTSWRPTYYCVLDIDYIHRYQDEIFSNIDVPIFTNDAVFKNIKAENRNGKKIIYSKQIFYSDFKAWPHLMKYTYGTHQGTIMSYVMAVALYMGFSEIYILGMDNSSTTGGNHFAGYKEDASLTANLEKRIKENNWNADHWKNQTEYEMNKFIEYAEENNIKIYNATRGGMLEVFPRVNIDDCIK